MTHEHEDKFILRMHASGNWSKTINSKQYYFGKDKQKALAKYERLIASMEVKRPGAILRLDTLANSYLRYVQSRVRSGDVTQHTFESSHNACRHLIEQFGKRTPVLSVKAIDWTNFHVALSGKLAPASVALNVSIIRTMCVWAHRNELLREMPRFVSKSGLTRD